MLDREDHEETIATEAAPVQAADELPEEIEEEIEGEEDGEDESGE